MQYNSKQYSAKTISTIGLDFVPIQYELKDGSGTSVTAKIWDTAGQERFRSLTYQMYKQADGIIMVFSKINKETFEGVR